MLLKIIVPLMMVMKICVNDEDDEGVEDEDNDYN